MYVEGNEKYYQMGEQELEDLIKSGAYVQTKDRIMKDKVKVDEVKTPNCGNICFTSPEPEAK